MPETDPKRLVETVPESSGRILDLASAGSAPLTLLSESLAIIAKSTGCSSARLVIRDQGRQLFVQYREQLETEFPRDASISTMDPPSGSRWAAAASDDLEALCRRVYNAQVDSELPWFTGFGSLRIDDVDSFPGRNLRSIGDDIGRGIHLGLRCRSVLIVPVDGARRRLGLLQLESDTAGFFDDRRTSSSERLAQTLGFAFDLCTLQTALRKRSRELACLRDLVRLLSEGEPSLDELLQRAAERIPSGWLHHNVAAARIVMGHRTYESRGADRMVQRISAGIRLDNAQTGMVEVGYTEERPDADEGPFLHEERDLLELIARELASAIQQRGYAEERQNLQLQLRHADRLATIGQLAAGVAHELNEPLASIVGFAQLAGKQPGLPSDVTRDLNKIVASAMHAREIIRALLVFARETKPTKVVFSLNELIRDGLYFLESRFDKAGINLLCQLDPDLPDIAADRSQLLQVLTNLVVNSVQAMPDGGRLTIRTAHRDGKAILTIEDTGLGMDEKTLKDIFHPFFTTKDVDQGTGLGLSVVHGIVTSHDGKIDVTSRPGEGTRVRIHLPLADIDSGENQTRAG